MGSPLPERMPELELSELSDDPAEARRIMERFERNLPKYMEDNQDPLLTQRDTWEEPPVSTGMRIFGRRVDNTTPQIVNAIKSIAGYGENLTADAVDRGVSGVRGGV